MSIIRAIASAVGGMTQVLRQRVNHAGHALIEFLQPRRFFDNLAPVAQAVLDLPDHKVRGVGREFNVFGRIVEFNGGNQADIALLRQVFHRLRRAGKTAGDALHQIRELHHDPVALIRLASTGDNPAASVVYPRSGRRAGDGTVDERGLVIPFKHIPLERAAVVPIVRGRDASARQRFSASLTQEAVPSRTIRIIAGKRIRD